MNAVKASRASQLGGEVCAAEDTEEMFWLRRNDDAQSRIELARLLAGQFRYRESLPVLEEALALCPGDASIWSRIGSTRLTLLDFDGSLAAFRQSLRCGAREEALSYPLALRDYLLGNYDEAAGRFAKCLPCDGETAVAMICWHTLSRIRGGKTPELLGQYRELSPGHHTAYVQALKLFDGAATPSEIEEYLASASDLDFVIAGYGLYRYRAREGQTDGNRTLLGQILSRESVWPCTSALAAWNDAQKQE